ncbi:GAF domain-containing sensor histidine kinase [Flavobacterium sp. MAH-1]|uniref:histidine kinase n=1 Tax=Flavobacterium agri TaxID=2743471 RepID=A0A7Y9C5P9_9FLAO|nr:GAF domain-containing sensor histidine kinase [Flavobacterium agri]NUY79578.1 GAF domain-containing sensor histidine kinase [Flavobacterium agri]NYA69603.1 GAF domain-containing sensor histidine kinase [Flavobacterium agri]
MIAAPIPANDRQRLDALLSYKVLDTEPEKDFDDITRLASEICGAPMSVITLLDENRQWFKSKIGLDLNESDRESSFCGHAITTPDRTFIVNDALDDERFHDNPHVSVENGVRSYAGVPLVNPDGFALGVLCVIDTQPKKLEEFQIKALEKLANQVSKLLELRKNNFKLIESHNALAQRYKDLEQFSHVVSHDIKSPLNNIMQLSEFFNDMYGDKFDDNGRQMIGYIRQSATELKKLVDGILEHYKYDTLDVTQREKIRLREFSEYIVNLLNVKGDFEFVYPDAKSRFWSNKMALGQILYNLIANAIKYNDKAKGIIEIRCESTEDDVVIFVKDNGPGIPESQFHKIFEIFGTLGTTDRSGNKGTGIGLCTVNKLVQKLGARIEVVSEIGHGSTFKVFLKK